MVESDDALREQIVAVLRDAGYEVSTNYQHGMKAVLAFDPDAVVLGADPPRCVPNCEINPLRTDFESGCALPRSQPPATNRIMQNDSFQEWVLSSVQPHPDVILQLTILQDAV